LTLLPREPEAAPAPWSHSQILGRNLARAFFALSETALSELCRTYCAGVSASGDCIARRAMSAIPVSKHANMSTLEYGDLLTEVCYWLGQRAEGPTVLGLALRRLSGTQLSDVSRILGVRQGCRKKKQMLARLVKAGMANDELREAMLNILPMHRLAEGSSNCFTTCPASVRREIRLWGGQDAADARLVYEELGRWCERHIVNFSFGALLEMSRTFLRLRADQWRPRSVTTMSRRLSKRLVQVVPLPIARKMPRMNRAAFFTEACRWFALDDYFHERWAPALVELSIVELAGAAESLRIPITGEWTRDRLLKGLFNAAADDVETRKEIMRRWPPRDGPPSLDLVWRWPNIGACPKVICKELHKLVPNDRAVLRASRQERAVEIALHGRDLGCGWHPERAS